MVAREKKNFLISVFISAIIFVVAFLVGTYVSGLSSLFYGRLTFFAILITGLIIFVLLMYKFRKRP